jgi:hypothetical protein
MKPLPSNSSSSFLRSPIILGGLAVVLIALVIVAVAGLFGGGDGNSNGGAEVKPVGTSSSQQADDRGGLTGKAKATINVRSDPGNEFQALGVLRKDTEVQIVAKSADGKWLQIIYPPRSSLRGWVLAESLDVTGDMSGLGIATPEQIPAPVVPTSAISTQPPITPMLTPTPMTTVTPLPQPPDLVISGTLISGGKLVATVTNQGPGPVTGAAINVSVYDLAGTRVLGTGGSGPLTLKPGASIDVPTNYAIPAGQVQLLLIVDPQGAIPETDDTNNRLTVSISGGGGQPTHPPPTQQPTPTP